jgi:predicted permease
MSRWRDTIRSLLRRASPEDDVSRELRAHVDLEIEERMESGQSPEAARAEAIRLVGNMTIVKEQVHDLSTWIWWEQLRQDVRHGMRSFRRSPAFALTAVLTLALGVGANGAIFSVLDALALRTLPVRQPEQLIVLHDTKLENFTYPDYLTLRDGNRTLDTLMAASSLQRVTIDAGGNAEVGSAKIVSANYFSGLGVRPGAGRLFVDGDDAQALAVLSRAYWQRRFGDSAEAVGRSVRVNGAAFTIVGVGPEGFFGETPGEAPDVWTTVQLQPARALTERGFSWLYPVGRLKPGVTAAEAQANLSSLLAAPSPESNAEPRVEVSSGAQGSPQWRSRVASPLVILMAIVGIVLLIACTNLASLLLTRGTAQQREIAMRLAIGASRGRVVRQLMTETLLLCAAGAVSSLAIALWGGHFLVRMASGISPGPALFLDLQVGLNLILFTTAVSTLAGLLFGLIPSLRVVRNASRLGVGAGDRLVGLERSWGLRDVLTVIQVALSLVLVAGSVMFIRTLGNLQSQNLGFRTDGLLRVELISERGYRPPATFMPQLLARTAAIPGVQSATVAQFGTLANSGGVMGLAFQGFTPRDPQDQRARADSVGPDYFRTSGIRLVAGRDFRASDDAAAPKVGVINQTAARFYFAGDAAALGRRFTFNNDEYEIVGVAENAKYADLRESALRMVYFSAAQRGASTGVVEIRSSTGDATSLAAPVRAAVREVDPRVSVVALSTLSQFIDRKLGREHLVADISGAFSALTLLLVSIGIYGTVAYTVGRRTKELGVRLALGARRSSVVWLVVRHVAVVLAIGLTLGSAAALVVGRLVRSLLFGLEPTDVLTFAGAVGLMIGVALLAAYLPAFRASRLDPVAALRE